MGIKKMALVAAVGLSMASAPVMAQTAPIERSSAVLAQSSAQDDEDGASTYIIAFFVVVAVGLGLYFAIDDEGDGRTSP